MRPVTTSDGVSPERGIRMVKVLFRLKKSTSLVRVHSFVVLSFGCRLDTLLFTASMHNFMFFVMYISRIFTTLIFHEEKTQPKIHALTISFKSYSFLLFCVHDDFELEVLVSLTSSVLRMRAMRQHNVTQTSLALFSLYSSSQLFLCLYFGSRTAQTARHALNDP